MLSSNAAPVRGINEAAVLEAARAAAASLPAAEPLVVGTPQPGSLAAAAVSAGAAVAQLNGLAGGAVGVLVGDDLVGALASSPLGELDLAAAVQPALDAAAAAVGGTAQSGVTVDPQLLEQQMGSPFTAVPETARGTTRSGSASVFTASGSASATRTCSTTRYRRPSPRSAACSRSPRSWSRLTASTVSSPVSSSRVLTVSSACTSPYLAVSRTAPPATSVRSTFPRAYRAVSANGWKVVCRQLAPPGSLRIGPMTFTSCARHAIATRSACRSSVIIKEPTTAASVTLYVSSISRGVSSSGSARSPGKRDWYQTFHSSKDSRIFFFDRFTARTWSAVATRSDM